jgi:uncharacterized protein
MTKIIIVFTILVFFSCNLNSKIENFEKVGNFSGVIRHGNFSDQISIKIERDSSGFNVYFTSLEQNANQIPFQNVEVKGDSINYKLQSDFYTYFFKNKWIENNSKLHGSLTVDTMTVSYTLEKDLLGSDHYSKSEEVTFKSNGFRISGTIWYPAIKNNNALIIVTSSGNADRSASRAEAILFSQMGFTTFHYNKRGTGNSDGNWEIATIEQLVSDDINAINYFSDKTGIPLNKIGIKGSSQGAAKVPYILNELESLKYGIAVSCPGGSLLESDLNYWRNRNKEALKNEIDDATGLQRKVFEYIAGILSRTDLERAIGNPKSKLWLTNVWVPNLDEVQIDKKLLYSPIPAFETTKQPILVLQGTLDEIIPANSHQLISAALTKASNASFETVLLPAANHSMYYVGNSDFPYWSKLHPDYLTTIQDWVNTVSKNE